MKEENLPSLFEAKVSEILIHFVRDQYVMLDSDVAFFFGVETKRLIEQTKRNEERFPKDFCFKLNSLEFKKLRSQNAIFRKSTKGRKYAPYFYTENGIVALAGVLKSNVAARASVEICRKFNEMRKTISQNSQLLQEVSGIKKEFFEFKNETNKALDDIYRKVNEYDLPKNRVIAEGHVYDAFEYIVKIIQSASESVVLVDPYADSSAFIYLNHKKENTKLTIYKGIHSKLTKEEVELFEIQNGEIKIYTRDPIHDRYFIIDQKECFLLGGSLNRTARSLFAIIKFSLENAKQQVIKEYPLLNTGEETL